MSGSNEFSDESDIKNISFKELLLSLPASAAERLAEGYDMLTLAEIFSNADTMNTVDAFIAAGMNVSAAARVLYMHRNTLNYRLNAIKARTGLELRNFDCAVTFKILQALYEMKKEGHFQG